MSTTVLSKGPSELWTFLNANDIRSWFGQNQAATTEIKEIPIGLANHAWFTFRTSEHAALERAKWNEHVLEEDWVPLRLEVTTKGVGHLMQEGTLTTVLRHGTWRFHDDIPFTLYDDEGALLLCVDTQLMMMTCMEYCQGFDPR